MAVQQNKSRLQNAVCIAHTTHSMCLVWLSSLRRGAHLRHHISPNGWLLPWSPSAKDQD